MKKSQMNKDFERKSALRGYSSGGLVRPMNGLLSDGLIGRRPDVIEGAVNNAVTPPVAPPPADPFASQRAFTGTAPRAPRGLPPPDMMRRIEQRMADGGMVRGYSDGGLMSVLRGRGKKVDSVVDQAMRPAPPPPPPPPPEPEPKPIHFANGGYANGGLRHMGAGPVEGPGGPREDRVPAMLSDGEYVLPAKTVKAIGGPAQLDQLVRETNDGREPGPKPVGRGAAYAEGGFIDEARRRISGAASALRGGAGGVGQAVGAGMQAASDAAGRAAAAASEFTEGVRMGQGRPTSASGIDVGDATMDDFRRAQAGMPGDVGDMSRAGAAARARTPTPGLDAVSRTVDVTPQAPAAAGRIGSALRTAGRVAAPIALGAQAVDTAMTPTEEYAGRLSQITGRNLQAGNSFLGDLGLRAAGTAYDALNAATFGIADRAMGVQRGTVPAAAAPAVAAPAAAAEPLAPTPGAFSPAPAPGSIPAQNVAQAGMRSTFDPNITASGMVERGNQGLRALARDDNARAAFNNMQAANRTGIEAERDVNGRVMLTNAPGQRVPGPTEAQADANRQGNIAGMERTIEALRGLRAAREAAAGIDTRPGGVSAPIQDTGIFLSARAQAAADEMRDRGITPTGFVPAGLRQQLINRENNRAADQRQSGQNAVQMRGQDIQMRGQDITARGQDQNFQLGLRGQDVQARGQDLTTASSRYATDAGTDNNLRTVGAAIRGQDITDRREAAKAASAAGQREFERFGEAAKNSFFTTDANGKQVPDQARSARFMDFVRNSGVPIEALNSQQGFATARQAFEISERFNQQQARSLTGRQSNSPLRPTGTRDASIGDVANGGLSLRDYIWSNLPLTNPNVVTDSGGRAALAGQVFDAGNENVDMDLLNQFFRQR